MEDFISQILKIEQEAQEMVCEARERRRNLDQEIDDTQKTMKNDLRKESEQSIAAYRQELEAKAEAEALEIKRTAEGKRKKMEATFAEKKADWEADLVEKIIGA